MAAHILLVDDDSSIRDLLGLALQGRGYRVTGCASAREALALLPASEIDVVLTDLMMPGLSGNELCARLAASRPDIPTIVLTAHGSLESAVEAIRAGAYDFLVKPPELDRLVLALERAVQHRSLREEVKRLRRAVHEGSRFEELVGGGPRMRVLFDTLERVAASDASVLVTGETGSGKELVARALHRRGRRPGGRFVAVNCGALPEALLESELFGHVRGAFTDAKTSRTGLFPQADGGTLFLDEIGDMPLALQAKLLRVLEERRVRPLGGTEDIPFDARIIAATHRDLEAAVLEKRFREDLFYRLNVLHVEVPPLRARAEDVLPLARSFLAEAAARAAKGVRDVSDAAAERLIAYDWPGNVRELRNCIERAVALTAHETITVEDLPEKVRQHRRFAVAGSPIQDLVPLEEIERRYILHVVDAVGGNKALAARTLGLDRATLYRKLQQFAK